ncbi:hypothetical protein [Teichococcus wenyumeiae]|nr:hypothetical protein [Pseudoroseomonas wenyumeiae]
MTMPDQLQGGTMMTMGKAPAKRERQIVAGCSYALGLVSIGAAVITLALV